MDTMTTTELDRSHDNWPAVLDGRPWVCTESEQARLDRALRLLGLFTPRSA
jgi:hypothetical protein